jgi:hypothetical protein
MSRKPWFDRPVLIGILVGILLRVLLHPLVPATRCRDGWESHSIGIRGACSHHGGVGTNWGALLIMLVCVSAGIAAGRFIISRRRARERAVAERFEAERSARALDQYNHPLPPPSSPACPKCGASMVKRVARKGRSQGEQFWGCSSFPRCKGTRAI